MHVALKEENFANDYKKESYNISIFIKKIKNLLVTFKKKFLIFKMKNSKTLKIEKKKIVSEFFNLKNHLQHLNVV